MAGDWYSTISKSLRQYLSKSPGKHENKETAKKKYSHIGHCTFTAGSADVKVQNILNIGEWQALHVAQIVKTEQLQYYVI
jgi:hypothetical protein